MIIQFIRGFCMALADSVPGVSGGTIAFLLGFYDKFIGSLDDLIHGSKQERLQALIWLLKLAVGWACGFILAVLVLTSLFESHIYVVSSLFLGFIIFAIPIVAYEERANLKAKLPYCFFLLLGAALVVLITFANPLAGEGIGVSASELTLPTGLYIFFAAMIAISAMVLPGISGSTLLLIFGLYVPIMGAVRAVLGFDFSYVPALAIFAAGIVCGIIAVVRLVRYCLERFRAQTVFAIIGMMVGSLYAITQGPLTLDIPQPPLSLDTFSLLFFLIGGVIVVGLQGLQWLLAKTARETNQEKVD